MSTIANLVVKVQADVADLKTGVSQTNETLASMEKSVGSLSHFFGDFEGVLAHVAERFAAFELLKEGLEFSKEAFESAAALEDLSRQTGVTADQLQRLQYVAITYGVDQETLVRGAEMLAAKLAGGDASAARAMAQLGLNTKDLLAMRPDQAFMTFTAAASSLQDPMDKNAIYAETFGNRLGRLLTSMGDVTQAMKDVPQGALISDETIKSAHDFDVELKQLTMEAKAWAAEFITATADVVTHMKDVTNNEGWTAYLANLARFAFDPSGAAGAQAAFMAMSKAAKDNSAAVTENSGALAANGEASGATITHAQEVANWLASLKKGYADLTNEQEAQITQAHLLGASNSDIAKTLQLNESAVTSYVKNLDEQRKAEDELNKAVTNIDSASQSYLDTVKALDAVTVDSLKHYLSVGVSQKDLALYYGLTEAQIRAVSLALREEQAETEKQNNINKATMSELTRLMQEYDALRSTHGHTTTEQQIADVQLWRDAVIHAAEAAGTATKDFYDALDLLTKEKTADILVDWQKVNDVLSTQTQAGLQQVANKAQATFETMLQYSGQVPDAIIQQFRDAADKAAMDAATFGESFDTTMTTAAASATTAAQTTQTVWGGALSRMRADVQQTETVFKSFGEASDALTDAYQKAGIFVNTAPTIGLGPVTGITPEGRPMYGGSGRLPGFADGGIVMVGERGPEAVRLPFGSHVYPNGTLPGGHTINITVNAQTNATPQQISDAMAKQLKTLGVRF